MFMTSGVSTSTPSGFSHENFTATTALQSNSKPSSGSLSTTSSTRDVTVPEDVGHAFGSLFSQLVSAQTAAAAASIEADRATDKRIAALETTVREQHKAITALQQSILAQSSAHKAVEEARKKEMDDLIEKLTLLEHRFVNHFHGPFPQQPRGATNITMTSEEVRDKRPNIAKTKAGDNTKQVVYEMGRVFPEMDFFNNSDVVIDYLEDNEI